MSKRVEFDSLYISAFDTGLWTNRSPLNNVAGGRPHQDALLDGLNVEVSNKRTLQRRPGHIKFSTVQLSGSEVPRQFYSFRNLSAVVRVMLDTGTHVAEFDASSRTDAYTLTDSTAEVHFQHVGNTLYFSNGIAADIQKWDGTTASKWGIDAPTVAPAFTTSAGSLSPVTGFKWVFVYRNSTTGHISSASPISLDSGAETSKQFDLTGASSADSQVDKVEIYRTTDGGAIFFRVGETNNGGTWAFTDNVADLALGTLQPALAGENDPPPVGLINLAFHVGRVWGSVGNVVHYGGGSDIINGVPEESFQATATFTFPAEVTAIRPFSLGLLVFTAIDTWVIRGIDPVSFWPQILDPKLGVENHHRVAADGDSVYIFTSTDQAVRLAPGGVLEVGFPIAEELEGLTNVHLTVHRDSSADSAVYLTHDTDNVERMFRYNLATNTWSPSATIVNGARLIGSVQTGANKFDLLITRSIASGFILKRDRTEFTDDAATYDANFLLGSAVLVPPGSVANVKAISLDRIGVGGTLTMEFLPNDFGHSDFSATFAVLPKPVNEPPEFQKGTNSIGQKHYLAAAEDVPHAMRHLQVKVSFPKEAAKNEVLSLNIEGTGAVQGGR